jgi:hypothetical protein
MRYFVVVALFLFSCKAYKPVTIVKEPNKNVLLDLLAGDTSFSKLIRNKDSFRLQVIYTQINRDDNNKPTFTDYYFNVNDTYFYPASTVKMPTSFLALEKLNSLAVPALDKHSIMITDSSFSRHETVYNNYMAQNGIPSVAEYIKEIFLVSDNDAFNRLYEFLGQHYLNEQLHKKGFASAEIIHRLNVFLSEEQNRVTNPVSFYDTSCNLLLQQPAIRSKLIFSGKKAQAGKGYYAGGKLQNAPFNFSAKNRLSLPDLHQMLRVVLFPEVYPGQQRFQLTAADYRFLYKYMSAYPSEIKDPAYNTAEHPDADCKFLLFGANSASIKPGVRIFNKIGEAYGFLTDVAYIIDVENKVEFMLSATILCNTDGIFNDDTYDYNTIGFPFMKQLGEVIYQHEKSRVKKQQPDLSKFIIDYSAADTSH